MTRLTEAPQIIVGRDGKAYIHPRTEGDSAFYREQFSGLPLQSVKPVAATPEPATFLPALVALVVVLMWARMASRATRGRS